MALEEVMALHVNLRAEWDKKPEKNLMACGKILNDLKVALTKLTFLPTSNTTATQKELLISREVLEIGALWSILTKNIPSFERYMAQLKSYYLDYKGQLPESTFQYLLLGLNLLHLLSQNRVAEFHTELELLPSDVIHNNIFIEHPLRIEQHLMEGNYNKIFLAKGNVPADYYNFFIDILLETIRNEIAGCMEVAYQKVSLADAKHMLNFSNNNSLTDFAKSKKWILGPDKYFHFAQMDKKKSDEVLPSKELVTQTMEYARELEMIV